MLHLKHPVLFFALKQIGKILKVLFEKRDGDYLVGHASDYLKIKV